MKAIRKLVAFASAALLLGACSQETVLTPDEAKQIDPKNNEISFGTFVGKSHQTRAISAAVNGGVPGSITSAQALAQHRGFGVFAYYTEDDDYLGTTSVTPPTAVALTSPQASAITPNFMYNQEITGTDAESPVWTYSPIKYWPNGNATADDQDPAATGTPGGKVSFFAYAPFVATTGSTGITNFSANSATGNPTITYKIDPSGNVVDLLWGTAGTNGVKAQTGDVVQNGDYIAVDPSGTLAWAERPFPVNANLTKMKTTGKVQFVFKHALAKVGGSSVTTTPATTNGLQIVLDIDKSDGSESGGTYDNTETKVTVQTIDINVRSKVDANNDGTPDKYLTAAGNQGVLDLATGMWTIDKTGSNVTDDLASASTMSHRITSPKSTGTSNATLNTAIAEPASLADGGAAWDGLVNGVLTTVQNVYNAETNPLIYIPGTYPELQIAITYITRTKDANLAKGYSEVSQTITRTITFAEAVKLNKQYSLVIHLGLTSVKFDAIVSDWDPDIDGDGDVDTSDSNEIHLPINVAP